MTEQESIERADLWIVRWGAKVEGIRPIKLVCKLKPIDLSGMDYSFCLPAEHLSDPHLRAGMLKSMASCGIDITTACAELVALVGNAQAAGKRGVLVITGKGRADQGYGVLRRAVPTWLNQPPNRARIIAVHDAQPRDGGSGALYLLLRKRR